MTVTYQQGKQFALLAGIDRRKLKTVGIREGMQFDALWLLIKRALKEYQG